MLCFLFTSNALAKRASPKEIEPIIQNQIKYTIPRWGEKQNGGYIEAYDSRTNDLLWKLKVYTIKYNKNLENDVQDIFINRIEISNDELIIWNEVNDKFIVNLKTRKITPKNKIYKSKN